MYLPCDITGTRMGSHYFVLEIDCMRSTCLEVCTEEQLPDRLKPYGSGAVLPVPDRFTLRGFITIDKN